MALRRAAGGRGRLGVLAVALALCLAGHGAAAQDGEEGYNERVADLARAVIAKIPEGETIALIPFQWPITNLPARETRTLYKDINFAMYRASAGRHYLTLRDNIYDDIWEATKWELANDNYQEYVDRLAADVVVHCEDLGLAGDKIKISCTSTGVGERSALAGKMLLSQEKIPIPDEWQPEVFSYEYALTRLSNELAAGAQKFGRGAQKIKVAFIGFGGQRSELTEDIATKIQEGIRARFRQFRDEHKSRDEFEKAKGWEPGGADETPEGYELRGEFKWTDGAQKMASLSVRLLERGEIVAEERIELKRSWLPHTAAGTRRYTAAARAMSSDSLHDETAAAAAMNIARARVVAEAVGMDLPALEGIVSEADGIAALEFLSHGIPVDARSNTWQDTTGEWHVQLDARVVAVGWRLKPGVDASLTKNDLNAGEQYSIEVSAVASVHVGVFAWGSDGGVVRYYPNAKVRDLIVPAGGRVSLPHVKDEYQYFWSAPLPGHTENHEAFVVVASVEPLDFKRIGAIVGSDMTETMNAAIPAGIFLDALGEFDLSQATVLVLPYRVSK